MFNREKYRSDPLRARDSTEKWHRENPEASRRVRAEWKKRNPEMVAATRLRWQRSATGKAAIARAHQKKMRDPEFREKNRAKVKAWREANPEHAKALRAKRRAAKLKAVLPGFDKETRQIYMTCPKNMELDHIVPLLHPDVCGLHVPWNLQPLTPEENRAKGNKFDPTGLQGQLGKNH